MDMPDVAAFWAILPEARIIGGAVRDGLLGMGSADVDFATPALPDDVMSRLRTAGVKVVATGLAHGTVTAILGTRRFEVTTLRRDVTTDGRHATVVFTDDWRVDAGRRDFTINAMSLARDGAVFDYFCGAADLSDGRVRFVGAADVRITEDFLRILRFFRFFARYARGQPDAAAMAAIEVLRDGLRQLSAERVWSEIKLILAVPDPRDAVRLMARTGVLEIIMPGAHVAALEALAARGAPAAAMLRVAAFMGEPVAVLAERLRLSGAETDWLLAVRAAGDLSPEMDDAALRAALAETSASVLVAQSWLRQDETPGWDDLRRRMALMARPEFALRGADVTALGVAPGPDVGRLLAAVRRWWLAGGCVADRAACLVELRRIQ